MQRGASSNPRSIEQNFVAWMQQYHNAKTIAQADALPLRRDMVTLLGYVRDHKVVGTQSTGNMPRKAVREVTARFAEPPRAGHGTWRTCIQAAQ